MLKYVIIDFFPNNNEDDIIKDWRSHNLNEKTDIFLKIINYYLLIFIFNKFFS